MCTSVMEADHPCVSEFDPSRYCFRTILVHWDHTSYVARNRGVSDACTAFTDQFSVGGHMKGPVRPTWDSDACPSLQGRGKDKHARVQ